MSAMQDLQTPVLAPVDYDPFGDTPLARTVPSTAAQRELWLADQLDVDASLAYNEAVTLQIDGRLDATVLSIALHALGERHDMLRTALSSDGLQLLIEANSTLTLARTDLSQHAPAAQQAALAALTRAAVRTPFDLMVAPLMRATLVDLGAQRYRLILSAHHIVCDGWSFGVIARELMHLYALKAGAVLPALAPADSFAEHALASLAPAAVDAAAADARYWAGRFDGALPVLELPLDRPRPARRTFTSRREDLLLPAALTTAVRQLGARHGCSVFATLLSLYGALLARLSGSPEVVVGIPVAGQASAGKPALVGHCVSLLPVALSAPMDASVATLLAAGRGAVLDACEHDACGYGDIVKTLQIARDPARLTLVSVLFNYEDAIDPAALPGAGLRVSLQSVPRDFENFELFLNAVQREDGIALELQYNTDLFDQASVQRWLQLYRCALERSVLEPGQSLATVLAPTPADFALLAAFNATTVPDVEPVRIEALIARQAAATPQAIAAQDEAGEYTYADLDARSNGVALALRQQGVAIGDLVGLQCGRTIHMLAGMLGILKAGAGYVPLDPGFPAQRLAFMAADAGVAAIVTDGGSVASLAGNGVPQVRVDQTTPSTMAPTLPSPPDADGIAYVIYTSGSTGQPKGVRVRHRNVINLLASCRQRPGMQASDIVLAVTTLSFDIAVSETLLPLAIGARVVIAGRDQTRDGERLAALIADTGVTFIDATPSTWRMLLAAGWRGAPGLRAICTGEPLPADLARALLPCVGELWNGYGPTETTVWSSFHRVTEDSGLVPIGTPLHNTRFHVVDAALRPLPPGVTGELLIGGAGVSAGYLGRPALDAERFITAPELTGDSHERLYRTGDLGRWRADGVLECFGRSDDQIKLRGYRIEPGEIAGQLSTHPGLRGVLVMAREDRPGDVRLVAYLEPDTDAGTVPDATALRAHLAPLLPEYMIPQHFVFLEKLPQLANGKTDRARLPAPVASAAVASEQTMRAPATPLEEQVRAAMQAVLGLPSIGLEDNFFALGGHSLLAAQLAARISADLGLRLPLRVIFEAPSVARLATLIELHRTAVAPASAVVARQDRSTAPLSPVQQRLWFLEQVNPGLANFNTPSAHRLTGPFDLAAFRQAFADVVRRQDSLRTSIVVIDGEPQQRIDPATDAQRLAWLDEPEDLRTVPPEQREAVLQQRLKALSAQPIALGCAPLFHARLMRTGQDEHVFCFCPHHIIWDGWSFDILYAELATHYAARCQQQVGGLEPLTLQYGDFAAAQRTALQGSERNAQVAHWQQTLAGDLPQLSLATTTARLPIGAAHSAALWLLLSPAMATQLHQVAAQRNTTVFVVLLAMYALTLARSSGQDEIVIAVPVRGRNGAAQENVMGMFVNALPLRLRIDGNASVAQLLQDVHEAVTTALRFPDVPFEELVRVLNPPRDVTRSPVYQTMFSFQDARERARRWGPLEHDMIHVEQPHLAEDVALWFMEKSDGIIGCLTYRTDLFDQPEVELLRQRFQALLDEVVAGPMQTIAALALPVAERDRLSRWGSNPQPYPDDLSIDALLAQRALTCPSRIAVRDGGTTLTYAELMRRVEGVALALGARGIGCGDLVGLALQRGHGMLTALLGILRSGAAYVPLDPNFPPTRLAYMATDATLALLLADADGSAADGNAGNSGRPDWLPASVPVTTLDALLATPLPPTPALAPTGDASGDPDALAYVIYTSGSTGNPKGVQITHRAVVNFLTSMQRQPGITAGDRLLAVTTLSFDIAVLELLLPLAAGAEVVLASSAQASDAEALATLLVDSGATMMQATPATWHMLLANGWTAPAAFRGLIGGEALAPSLARALCAHGVELWNMYGPTETTVWSTCWRVPAQADAVCIGGPIANTTVRILDRQGQLCPIGAIGELCIGGLGLSTGYLHRPELTAERFMADPFAQDTGARLYRTGDLARWHSDGSLVHMGRNDDQIKVRGFRIEPGDIEAVLLRQPEVARCIVLAREDNPGDVRLVAYVVARGEHANAVALRAACTAGLPAYMVPQHVVLLPALPALPNGKVDRAALPPPPLHAAPLPDPAAGRTDGVPVAALLSATESLLKSIWQELLHTEGIRAQDNFFDLGGHSLLVMQAIQSMFLKTGKRVNPGRFIFETLRQVAQAYDEIEVEKPRVGGLKRLFSGWGGKDRA